MDYFSVLVSSLAFSNAPRLVEPVAAADVSAAIFFMAESCSVMSLALIDRLITRFLRSTLMIMAFDLVAFLVVGTHVFHTVTRHFGRAQVTFHIAVQLHSGALSLRLFLIVPLDDAALLVAGGIRWSADSPSICLMPSEIRSRSRSIPSTTASTSWPLAEVFARLLRRGHSMTGRTNEPSHRCRQPGR